MNGKGTLSHTSVNRCVQIVRAVYNRQLKNIVNPANGIENYDEVQRDRFLHGDELAKIFVALDDERVSRNIRDVVLLALTVGARKNNIMSMR